MIETEVKIKLTDGEVKNVLKQLPDMGFQKTASAVYEYNVLYDTVDNMLGYNGKLLRLRSFGDVNTLTFKGPEVSSSKFKSREEIETTVGQASVIERILATLGYTPKFTYEKERTVFAHCGHELEVCLDKTPGGYYLEIEGEEDHILHTASRLGFGPDRFITESYPSIYRKFEETEK